VIPHSIVIDDFLPDFAGWRARADSLKYEDETNPADGVSYPGIYRKVPTWGMRERLSMVMDSGIRINAMFLRLSLEGVPVPHYAHTDKVMGQFSCMVYLNRPEHCRGGTALIRHCNGMDSHPKTQEEVEIWKRDTNRPDKWNVYSTCEMKANRAFIFRADLFHAALPFGGFGTDARNGRLVATAFFDLCN
jgi:hypothetical protein